MKLYLKVLLPSIFACKAYAQVTIGNVETIKKEVIKPAIYDSLKDFEYQDNLNQYIGLQLFLPPNNASISGKYYTIVDILDADISFTRSFLLIDDLTKETISIAIPNNVLHANSLAPYIFVPYFVKQKQLYNGKKFIAECDGQRSSKSINGVNTECNSKWTCEVTLLKNRQIYYSDTINFMSWGGNLDNYSLAYILKNKENKTIVLSESFVHDKSSMFGRSNLQVTLQRQESNGYFVCFIEEGVYLKNKLKKEELIAKRKQEEQTKLAKEKANKENNKAYCIKEFGEQQGKIIAEGKVTIGMDKKMCKAAWGNPFKIDTTTTAEGVLELWHYSWKKNLYFENGTLVRIES